nr:MAG TPA: hypothetical protein [Bacteriophage sp.]
MNIPFGHIPSFIYSFWDYLYVQEDNQLKHQKNLQLELKFLNPVHAFRFHIGLYSFE